MIRLCRNWWLVFGVLVWNIGLEIEWVYFRFYEVFFVMLGILWYMLKILFLFMFSDLM